MQQRQNLLQRNNELITKSKDAIAIIKQGNGWTKVIASKLIDWNFMLNQMANLNDRPKDLTGLGADGVRWDPLKKATYKKELKKDQNKKHTHTKKTAGSLLPAEVKDENEKVINAGRMFLFGTEQSYGIGLLFDITECDQKGQKYFFKGEALTFNKWWKEGSKQDSKRGEEAFQSSPLEVIKKYLADQIRKTKKPLDYSELMVGVNKEAAKAIFFQARTKKESKADRKEYYLALFDAIRMQVLTKQKTGLDLPIIFINADQGVTDTSVYTLLDQKKDLEDFAKTYGTQEIGDLVKEFAEVDLDVLQAEERDLKLALEKQKEIQPKFKIDVFAKPKEDQFDGTYCYTAQAEQFHLIEQFLKTEIGDEKKGRDTLIKRCADSDVKRFYQLAAAYFDNSREWQVNAENKKKFKKYEKRSRFYEKAMENLYKDLLKRKPLLSGYFEAYYYCVIQGTANEGECFARQQNSKRIHHPSYHNIGLKKITDELKSVQAREYKTVLSELYVRANGTDENILKQAQLFETPSGIVNATSNTCTDLIDKINNLGQQNDILVDIDNIKDKLKKLRQAAETGNHSAIAQVKTILSTYRAKVLEMPDICNKVGFAQIEQAVKMLLDSKTAERFSDAVQSERKYKNLYFETFKVEDYVNKMSNEALFSRGIVSKISYEKQYDEQIFALEHSVENVLRIISNKNLNINEDAKKILENIHEQLVRAKEQRIQYGQILYPPAQLTEIEEAVNFYKKLEELKIELKKEKSYTKGIDGSCEEFEKNYKNLVENRENDLENICKNVVSHLQNGNRDNRNDKKEVGQVGASNSITTVLVSARQFIQMTTAQFHKDQNNFYRSKLIEMKKLLETWNYDCGGFRKLVIEHAGEKHCSHSASDLHLLLRRELASDQLITREIYDSIMQNAEKILNGKTKVTTTKSRFAFFNLPFFHFGERSQGTVDLYNKLLNMMRSPIKQEINQDQSKNQIQPV